MLDLQKIFQEHIQVAQATEILLPKLKQAAEESVARLQNGGKILFCGNGGSAMDAQHFAAELIGRFYLERKAIQAIALTADSAVLTSLGNDYSYDIVFSRQLEALCAVNDVVVLLSTSGNSPNVIKAAEVAQMKGAYTIGFTNQNGGKLKDHVDCCFQVPSENTPRVQEMHLLLGHTLCEWIELAFAEPS